MDKLLLMLMCGVEAVGFPFELGRGTSSPLAT